MAGRDPCSGSGGMTEESVVGGLSLLLMSFPLLASLEFHSATISDAVRKVIKVGKVSLCLSEASPFGLQRWARLCFFLPFAFACPYLLLFLASFHSGSAAQHLRPEGPVRNLGHDCPSPPRGPSGGLGYEKRPPSSSPDFFKLEMPLNNSVLVLSHGPFVHRGLENWGTKILS